MENQQPVAVERSDTRDGRMAALGYLAVLIFAWGGNYTWMKMALADIGPWTLNFIRYTLSVLLIGIVLALRGRASELVPVRGERLELAIVGFLQVAVITGATAVAMQWIEASRTVLIAYSVPVWTILLSAMILRERPTWAGIAGTLIGFVGLAVLTNPFAMEWGTDIVPGTIAALIGTLGWALGSVLYRRRTWRSTFWQQLFWQLAVTVPVMGPAWALLEWDHPIRLTPTLFWLTIYIILVPTVIGFWCWSQALSRLTASAASQVLLLSPVYGILQSHVVLGEPLTPDILAATACIVAGTWITLTAPPRQT